MDFAQLIAQMSPEQLQEFLDAANSGDMRDQLGQTQQMQTVHQGKHHSFLGGLLGGLAPGIAGAGAQVAGRNFNGKSLASLKQMALARALQSGGGADLPGMGPIDMGMGGF